MPDINVACSCGRNMTTDALHGKGAYRCGCGARVTVTVTARPACLAVHHEGTRCPYAPIRESEDYGISLCREHIKGHRAMLEVRAEQDRREQEFLHGHRLDPRYLENTPRAKRSLRLDLARQRGSMVVYYIRIGHNIKIGWTTDLKLRMISLMPDEILATEPGPQELERARHQQFAHLRVPPGRERFKPDPELMDHIQMLREHYGQPSATFPMPNDAERDRDVPVDSQLFGNPSADLL